MKQQTELKKVRYGSSSKLLTKSIVLYFATFLLLIHVVKSSAIRDEEATDDHRNAGNSERANGELNFYCCLALDQFLLKNV